MLGESLIPLKIFGELTKNNMKNCKQSRKVKRKYDIIKVFNSLL